MKKFLLILFLSPVLTLQAQLSAGVYGGMNLSKLRGDTPKDVYFNTLPNGDIGGFLEYNFNDQVIVGFQPYYTRKGTKVSFRVDDMDDPVDSVKIHLSYFSFPVIIKVLTNKKKWYVLGGAGIAKPLRSFYKYVDGTDERTDISDKVAPLNVYLQFGVGRRWKVWNNKYIFGEIRYFQSLINTIRKGDLDPAYLPRVRTRGTQISVGLDFPLTGKKRQKP